MFVDEAVIFVRGGRGGNGCVSFRREAFVPRGGPDGGNGGRGGDVVLVADESVQTLLDFQYRPRYHAQKGSHGSGNNRTGRDGKTLRVRVPCGTIVRDAVTGQVLADLIDHDDECVVARGGRGGRGNKAFATPTHRVPYEAEPGEEGEDRQLRLELKLIADIGLVGLPNAGKSTLLSVISAARPKIASYPFTTLEPYLGIVDLPGARRFVVADIPGLIEGSHGGRGLGIRFLRHIERTRALLYVMDAAASDGIEPVRAYETLRGELRAYSPALLERPFAVALNKIDLLGQDATFRIVADRVQAPLYPISALNKQGTRELLEGLWTLLHPDDDGKPT